MKIIISAGKKQPIEGIQYSSMEVHATVEYDRDETSYADANAELMLALNESKQVVKGFSFEDNKKEYRFSKGVKADAIMHKVQQGWSHEEVVNAIKQDYNVSVSAEEQITNFITNHKDDQKS